MKTLPGKKKFMSLEELRKIIFESEIDKEITERDISIIFNCSMMTQPDEMTSYRIFEMSYTEFIEIIGRLADKVSLCSLYYTEEEVNFLGCKQNRFWNARGKKETASRCVSRLKRCWSSS